MDDVTQCDGCGCEASTTRAVNRYAYVDYTVGEGTLDEGVPVMIMHLCDECLERVKRILSDYD